MARVYVGNLPAGVLEHELEEEFKRFGALKSVWVARKPPGFAFIEFQDERDASDSIKNLNGFKGWRVELSTKGGGMDRGRDRFRDRSPRRFRRSPSYSRRNRRRSRSESYSRRRRSYSPYSRRRGSLSYDRSLSRSGSPRQARRYSARSYSRSRSPRRSRRDRSMSVDRRRKGAYTDSRSRSGDERQSRSRSLSRYSSPLRRQHSMSPQPNSGHRENAAMVPVNGTM
ncbi:hypothetical protein BSKO_03588 [Bryopsis sp. KO-2023]|nr:hypothetical protein BSKO_03588 [Bryopsis sp. KO-2023]